MEGGMDPVTSVQMLKENCSISEEVILMYDEMYLQKSEEYVGGHLVEAIYTEESCRAGWV